MNCPLIIFCFLKRIVNTIVQSLGGHRHTWITFNPGTFGKILPLKCDSVKLTVEGSIIYGLAVVYLEQILSSVI